MTEWDDVLAFLEEPIKKGQTEPQYTSEQLAAYEKSLKFQQNEEGNAYSVVGYNDEPTELVVPAQFNGLPVTAIGDNAFNKCESLQSIVLPSTVTTIGAKAFSSCINLTFVKISSGVTAIGMGAFSFCGRLRYIDVPGNVAAIGNMAFHSCVNLESVILEEGVGKIGDFVFFHCIKLPSLTIPNSVTAIGKSIAEAAFSLNAVTMPEKLAGNKTTDLRTIFGHGYNRIKFTLTK